MPEQRSWFITGISRGFGRALAIELLDRGHTVVGTTRDGSRTSGPARARCIPSSSM